VKQIRLHLARTTDAGDPYAFPFGKGRYGAFTYLRTRADGTAADTKLAWDEGVFSDLLGLRSPTPDPARLPSLGGTLRRFLEPLGWEPEARSVEDPDHAVHLTLELGAAELFALPWEAVELPSGARLGKLRRCLVRYAWPGSATAPRTPDPPPEDGRILVAWSAGGRGVPHAEHLAAIRRAYQEGGHPDADQRVVELPDVSLRALGEALAALATSAPVHVLHLVCHGGTVESKNAVYGLRLRTADGAGYETVDPERLADKLRPHAGTLRLVVLAACHGGDAGALDSRLGSIALALHRAGVPAVVASRYPLSWEGANRLADALYRGLLVELTSLEDAFLAARARLVELAEDEGNVDWASLQLYARAEDGPDQRPVVVRPYRGLLAFGREHARHFHGRDEEVREAVSDLGALIAAGDPGRPRFLVVTGASGTGKSSMVLAGAIPALLARDPRWVVAPVIRPTLGWSDELGRALAVSREPGAPLLIVVDQLEEVFTVLPDKAAREQFVRRLWEIAGDPASGVSVVATLRVDFLGRCGEIRLSDGGLTLEAVVYDEAHRVFVQRMGREALSAIIERPAAAVGLVLEEGLAARMLDDAGDEPGALPLCEYTLDALWQRRAGNLLPAAEYDRLGGVGGALAKRAGAALDALSEVQRRAARRILVQLVDTRDDAALDTRRRVLRAALRRGPGGEAAVFDEVLDALARERLVVVSDEGKAPIVEIAHEQLIRSFPLLRGWVAEDRAMLGELVRLAAWVAEAKAYDQPLSGKKLAEARVIVGRYEHEIDAEVRRFVAEGARREARAALRTRVLAGVALVAGTLVLVAAAKLPGVVKDRKNEQASVEEQKTTAAHHADLQRSAFLVAGARDLAARGEALAAVGVLVEGKVPRTAPGWAAVANDLLDARVARVVVRGSKPATSIAWSADGQRVVAFFADGTRAAWSPADGHVMPPEDTPTSGAPGETRSPDGRSLATLTGDGAVSVRSADDPREIARLEGHAGEVVTAAWSPDGERVVTASADATARIWSASADKPAIVLEGHRGALTSAAWSPDGKRIVTTSADKAARVWSADGKLAFVLEGHGDTVTSAAWSPDGKHLVTASADKTARVWSADDGKPVHVLEGHRDAVTSAAWNPRYERVVTASRDATARSWSAADGTPIKVFDGLTSAAWSPDGNEIMGVSGGSTAEVRIATSAYRLSVLTGHLQDILSAAWHKDGGLIVTASADGTAWVWTLGGKTIAKLTGHAGKVLSAAWSKDGERVVTASADHSARLWALSGEALETALRRATTVCLDPAQRELHLAEETYVARSAHDTCERLRGRIPVKP
jgi:WD40 repeat protein